MTPRFRAEVVMAPAPEEPDLGMLSGLAASFGGLSQLAGFALGPKSDTDQAIAILESRSFTEQFLVEERVLQQMYPDLWDAATGKWRKGPPNLLARIREWRRKLVQAVSSDESGGIPGRNPDGSPSLWFAYEDFSELRNVRKDRRTNIITLQVDWKDPQLAARWANQMVRRVNAYMRQKAREEAQRSTQYIDRQIEQTQSIALREGLYRLAENELRKAMLVDVRDEYAFRVLDPAVPPEQRVSPRRAVMTIGGLIMGGLVGLFLAMFRTLRKMRA
jgi:uncharacterized protein involved in exopolysaccharide biosynthesis